MDLLQSMLSSVLPVFLIAGLGYVARVVLKAQVKDPALLGIYVLTPGLIMNSILTSQVEASQVGKIIAYSVSLTAALVAVTLLLGRTLGWKASERNAAVLSTAFMNTANYGLPVVLLTFGEAGFDRAAIFVVVETVLMYTVAVYFAALGRMDWRGAVIAIFRLPLMWAAAVALVIRLAGISLPDFIMTPIGLLSDGAVVLVVLLLGMQMAGIRLKGSLDRILVASGIRLVLSPLVGLGLVLWLRPDPLTAKVLVLETAMPAAVNTTLLAVQFNSEPDQVAGTTLATTAISLASVSLWVWLLQGQGIVGSLIGG